jgi:NADH dehydrogenase [ubiquinone] 1 alpha subcomplex assembly factor 7
MFGELIGAWILQEWAIAGKPDSFEYLELGPGRGTLAKDALNAIQTLLDKVENEDDKKTKINIRFVEVSPVLSRKQAEALGEEKIFGDIEENKFLKFFIFIYTDFD